MKLKVRKESCVVASCSIPGMLPIKAHCNTSIVSDVIEEMQDLSSHKTDECIHSCSNKADISNQEMTSNDGNHGDMETSDSDEYDTCSKDYSRSRRVSEGALSTQTDEHCGWDRQIEYIFACCSFVNGLDSLIWFPKNAATYGGGVFLVMYLILTLTCGFPLLYMEMILGQYARGGPITAWGVIPLFKGLGVSMVFVSALKSVYYSAPLIWSLHFLISETLQRNCTGHVCFGNITSAYKNIDVSPAMNLTTTEAKNERMVVAEEYKYFYHEVLQISRGFEHSGHFIPYFVACLLILWIIIFFSLILGPQSIGKVVYITYGFAQVLAITFMVRCCVEDGAINGIKYFLNMKWNVLGNLEAWLSAGRLMFVSLGLGTGTLTSLSGYTHFHSHCFRNALITIGCHLIGMVVSGCTMFGILGIYDQLSGTRLENMNFTAIDLCFTLVPAAFARSDNARWLTVFYLLVVLSGIGTQCVYVQNVVSAVLHLLHDKWRFRWKYKCLVLGGVCCISVVAGLLLTSQGGLFFFHYSQYYVCKISVFLISLVECSSLAWIYGAQRLWNNVADMTGSTDSPWWKLTWRFLTLTIIIILTILCSMLEPSLTYKSYSFPPLSHVIGWLLTAFLLVPFLCFLVWSIFNGQGTIAQRFKNSLKTSTSWGPGPFVNQEPGNELPDYVICTPDNYKPENALAILTANLYIPNLTNLISAQGDPVEAEMPTGYLADLMAVDNSESDDEDDSINQRGNWSSRLDFVLSCLGYVVGLGNVWRFPYLVFRNGGGAFFIAYLVMLVFCGMPLLYLELAFGQYASLGPVTVWRAVPIFKGIGISMVLATTIISVYYNMINAWAFHFLFSSMMSSLPWLTCTNPWNTYDCSENKYEISNCSFLNTTWLSEALSQEPVLTNNTCLSELMNCTKSPEDTNKHEVIKCISRLRKENGDDIFINASWLFSRNLSSPSEEYFFNKVLKQSSGLGELGNVQWELALCLLLTWVIVFICLIKGVRTSGKVAYLVVTFPFMVMLILLIRALTMDGNMQGIKFYVTPKWGKLKEPGVWADAAVQVFFSLSVCMGGLTTLASYNKFHNNIYSDAILISLGDTMMSVLAGFSVFAMMGVLSNELNTDVEKVVTSGIGLAFIVNPAAMSYFPIAPLWSILFFLMIIMLGLSTQFVNIETIVTAIIDENIKVFRGKRVTVLFIVCSSLYLLGLPLTTQGGVFILTLMDEYTAGFPILINGIFVCIAIGWVYGVKQFCSDIKYMIGHSVGYWWKAMWCVLSPLIISFIFIFSTIGYKSLAEKYSYKSFPSWSEVIGFLLLAIPISSIPLWIICKLALSKGRLMQRVKKLCQAEANWGPALEKNWKNVEYYPAVNTNTLSFDIEHSPLHTVSDNVDFTTVGVRVPSLSSQTSLIPKSLSPKKPRDMRERAILNHAYSNPQCHQSTGSIEKTTASKSVDDLYSQSDVLIVQKYPKKPVEMKDAETQTENRKGTVSSGSSKGVSPASCNTQNESKIFSDCPAVLEVEVTKF